MEKDSSKIVLGQPLSGGLYAYFDEILNNGNSQRDPISYYKTLYGNNIQHNKEISLTLSLLYEDIIIPAADNSFPKHDEYENNGEYYNKDFGLYFTWLDEANRADLISPKITKTLEDEVIQNLLRKIDESSKKQILHETFFELSMAKKFNAKIFSAGNRLDIAKRLVELENIESEFERSEPTEFVSNYLEIVGLLFKEIDLDSFYYLKSSAELKEHSKAFRKIMENFETEPTENVRPQLLQLMKESIAKEKLRNKVSGILEGGSTATSILGLIPIIGTASSLIGLGADVANYALNQESKKHQWVEFGPQVLKARSIQNLEKAVLEMK